MDDQVLRAVGSLIDFDKVISAAEGTEAALKAFGIFQSAIAAQFRQVKALLPALPDVHA